MLPIMIIGSGSKFSTQLNKLFSSKNVSRQIILDMIFEPAMYQQKQGVENLTILFTST